MLLSIRLLFFKIETCLQVNQEDVTAVEKDQSISEINNRKSELVMTTNNQVANKPLAISCKITNNLDKTECMIYQNTPAAACTKVKPR